VDPIAFYSQAQEWFDSGDAEISVTARSIVSRAYYAAFLVARDKASLGEDESFEIHRRVLNYYEQHKPDLANQLFQLRRLRTDADYKMQKQCVRKQAREALERSRAILKSLRDDVPPPPRRRAA
jgi:uncharacterized protein (UPF0332 family)